MTELSADIPDESGERPEKPAGGWRRYIHSFVIIPACVALLIVVIIYVWKSGVDTPKASDYLRSIREGNSTVRWQSAKTLSDIFADPSRIPDENDFIQELLSLFEDQALYEDEPRMRLFLSLAMGRTGNPACFNSLMTALQEAKGIEEQAFYTRALGYLGDPRALDSLLPKLDHTEAVLRHRTVEALGFIGEDKARPGLREALDDPEPNVRWEAAVALAKLGDITAKPVLIELLDRKYYDSFPSVRAKDRTLAMQTAIHVAVLLNDLELNVKIKQLSESDPNIRVRGTALEIVKQLELE